MLLPLALSFGRKIEYALVTPLLSLFQPYGEFPHSAPASTHLLLSNHDSLRVCKLYDKPLFSSLLLLSHPSQGSFMAVTVKTAVAPKTGATTSQLPNVFKDVAIN